LKLDVVGSSPTPRANSKKKHSMAQKLCTICLSAPRLPYSSRCKSCHNEYNKKYYKKNPRSINESSIKRRREIRQLVMEAKSVPCSDCGIEYPYYVMDLDHLKEKKFNLSTASSKYRSLEIVQKEIDKCEVVCSNCHRERTFSRICRL
jgi:hypothetical protein